MNGLLDVVTAGQSTLPDVELFFATLRYASEDALNVLALGG